MLIRRVLVCLAAVAAAFAGSLVTAQADVTVTSPQQIYSTPGVHLVNDRYWRTSCEMYSSNVVRCTTEIFGTRVFQRNGAWYKQNDWVFNNLGYLASPRGSWAGNPLAAAGAWTAADGRAWRTECDTPNTGRGACRNYAQATIASLKDGRVVQNKVEVFNSIVLFSTSQIPAVQAIPASAAARSDVPVATAAVAIAAAPRASAVVPAPVAPPSTQKRYAPIGTSCPSNAPIKGNRNSRGEWIYHVPSGQFYSRTHPEDCFATERDARDAGYRKSQR